MRFVTAALFASLCWSFPARAEGSGGGVEAAPAFVVPAPASAGGVSPATIEEVNATPLATPVAPIVEKPAPVPTTPAASAAPTNEVAGARDGLSLDGPLGWARVASPRPARAKELRFGLAGTYFESTTFPVAGVWTAQGTGRLNVSYSLDQNWELYGALRSLATTTAKTVPNLTQAQGDFFVGGRGAWDLGSGLSVGGDARLFVPAGTGGLLPSLTAPALTLRGLFGWDVGAAAGLSLPLELAVNLGATFDRTGTLATTEDSPVADFAMGLVRYPHLATGLVVATQLAGFRPYLEFSSDVPLAVGSDALSLGTAVVTGALGAAAWRVTPGVRWTAASGVSIGAAAEIGLGNRVAIPGFSSAAPVNVLLTLGWATDALRPPPPPPPPAPAPEPEFLMPALPAEPAPPTTGAITGRVTTPDGQPVTGAVVVLGPGRPRAATDDTGSFEARDLQPGLVDVTVIARGLVPGRAASTVEAGKGANVTLTMEKEPPAPPKTTLAIALVDPTGRPVEGKVMLTGAQPLQAATQDGIARFDTISGGSWTVLATSPTQFSARRELRLVQGLASVQALVLAPKPAESALAIDLEKGRIGLVKPITFAEKKSELLPANAPILDELADALLSGPPRRVQVSAHVEKAGKASDAQVLTAARAAAVVAALAARGVPASQLEAFGAGFESPIAPGKSPKAREKNRRIELTYLP